MEAISCNTRETGGFRDAAIQLMSRAVRQKKTKTSATPITCTDSIAFVSKIKKAGFEFEGQIKAP